MRDRRITTTSDGSILIVGMSFLKRRLIPVDIVMTPAQAERSPRISGVITGITSEERKKRRR